MNTRPPLLLGICGSPRQGGNSEWALTALLSECERLGARTAKVLLSAANIRMCAGCLSCEDNGLCVITDSMSAINERLQAADVLVFSTPAYYDNVPGLMKNFIDRTNPIAEKLRGKKAAIIVTGQTNKTSWKNAMQAIEAYCSITGIAVIGHVFGKARNVGELSSSDAVKHRLLNLAKKIVVHAQ